MENNCNIAGDLMPLCAEGLASEDSKRLVDAHIKSCEKCRAAYDDMRADSEKAPDSAEAASAPLRKIKKEISKRRVRIAVLCALGVFIAMIAAFSFLTERHYIAYSPDSVFLDELSDGAVNVYVKDATSFDLTYTWMSDSPDLNDKPDRVELEAWYTLWDRFFSGDNELSVRIENMKAVDYCDLAADGELVRIYGEQFDGGIVVLERLVFSYIYILSVLGMIFFGVLWLIFRKRRAGRVFSRLFFVPVSVVLGGLVVGALPASYDTDSRFIFMLLCSAAIYAVIIISGNMITERRAER